LTIILFFDTLNFIKNTILKPIYVTSGEQITISNLKNCNRYESSVVGFNLRNVDFPFMHVHKHWEILLVVKGKIRHVINGNTHIAHKGYVCLIHPNDRHKIVFEDKANSETLTFCFSNEITEKLFQIHPSLERIHKKTSEPLSFILNNSTFEAVISKTIATQFFPKDLYVQYSILITNRLINSYVE